MSGIKAGQRDLVALDTPPRRPTVGGAVGEQVPGGHINSNTQQFRQFIRQIDHRESLIKVGPGKVDQQVYASPRATDPNNEISVASYLTVTAAISSDLVIKSSQRHRLRSGSRTLSRARLAFASTRILRI